jgi:hypothetical protein
MPPTVSHEARSLLHNLVRVGTVLSTWSTNRDESWIHGRVWSVDCNALDVTMPPPNVEHVYGFHWHVTMQYRRRAVTGAFSPSCIHNEQFFTRASRIVSAATGSARAAGGSVTSVCAAASSSAARLPTSPAPRRGGLRTTTPRARVSRAHARALHVTRPREHNSRHDDRRTVLAVGALDVVAAQPTCPPVERRGRGRV